MGYVGVLLDHLYSAIRGPITRFISTGMSMEVRNDR